MHTDNKRVAVLCLQWMNDCEMILASRVNLWRSMLIFPDPAHHDMRYEYSTVHSKLIRSIKRGSWTNAIVPNYYSTVLLYLAVVCSNFTVNDTRRYKEKARSNGIWEAWWRKLLLFRKFAGNSVEGPPLDPTTQVQQQAMTTWQMPSKGKAKFGGGLWWCAPKGADHSIAGTGTWPYRYSNKLLLHGSYQDTLEDA